MSFKKSKFLRYFYLYLIHTVKLYFNILYYIFLKLYICETIFIEFMIFYERKKILLYFIKPLSFFHQ